jgi:hypothetical protein
MSVSLFAGVDALASIAVERGHGVACDVCKGRGWVDAEVKDWWNFCDVCAGRGWVPFGTVARGAGVDIRTVYRVDDCRPVAIRTFVKIADYARRVGALEEP